MEARGWRSGGHRLREMDRIEGGRCDALVILAGHVDAVHALVHLRQEDGFRIRTRDGDIVSM